MRVLLTGANGFIGAHLTAALLAAGHQVVAAVPRPSAFGRRFPAAEAVAADMNRDASPEAWLPRLVGVDAVINCAGVLQGGSARTSRRSITWRRRRYSTPATGPA